MRCLTRKCGIYARLHIGSKIGAIESEAGAREHRRFGEIDPGRDGFARRGSDIDLFGYSKSIINLDAEVAHGALDLGVAKQSCAIIRILLSH
jgi:hypothetical protein